MQAYQANTNNMIEENSKKFVIPHKPNATKLVEAQYIVNGTSFKASNNQWQVLCQRLLKSEVKATLTGRDHLQFAIETVLEWDSEIDSKSFAKVRSLSVMDVLSKWQSDLAMIYRKNKHTKVIHFFELQNMNYMWIVVDNPEFDLILDYSEVYMNYLEKNNDALCEFMIFGEGEVPLLQLPQNTKSLF